jgi:hypothetical protein
MQIVCNVIQQKFRLPSATYAAYIPSFIIPKPLVNVKPFVNNLLDKLKKNIFMNVRYYELIYLSLII